MKKLNYKMKKSVISEQTNPDLRQQLEKFLSDGCVKDGVIVSMQSTNPSLQLAIKQESSRTPGKFRYVFSDKRIGSFNENGKFEFSPSKMFCKALQQSTAASVTGGSVTLLNQVGPSLQATVNLLSKQTGSFQSHKVYIE